MDNLSKSQKLVYDMEKYAGGSIAIICGSMLIEGVRDQTELSKAINELYRLNAGLRTRLTETGTEVTQSVIEYAEREIKTLRFESKDELDRYASDYAKEPFDFYGNLCEISSVLLPGYYGLLVKFHHIIGDAWAIALICTQYNALLNGEAPVAYPYAEYLASEAEYLQSNRYAKSRTFFLEQFKRCNEVVYLSEKQVTSFASNRKTFVLKDERAQQIYSYSRTQGVSPFVMFLTATAMYISRTKQNADKFYIGTTVLNRTGVREKNTMGMFVNTVPVLMELDNEKSAFENFIKAKKTAFSIFRHQKFNYGDVLAEIRKEYSFTGQLYDVVVSYQNAVITGAENHMETTWYHCGAQTESLQIHIDDRDSEEVFRIHFDYQVDKFTEQEIEYMYDHVINLLFDAIKNDNRSLRDLEILSADEKQKLLHDFNDTVADYPKDKCVHEIFQEQAMCTPNKPALIFDNQMFTYQQLDVMSNSLAHTLRKIGVGRNDVVPLVAKRDWRMVVALLAIFKAGGAYMPVDPEYPDVRIEYMISEVSPKAILVYDCDIPQASGANIVDLATYDFSYRVDAINSVNNVEDSFGVIFTSGTTGLPKGTVLCHRGAVNFAFANDALYKDCKYVAALAIVTFDAFFLDTICPIMRGTTCLLATEKEQFEAESFSALMNKYQNINMFITPTKCLQLLAGCSDKSFLRNINHICSGGEEFSDDLWKITTECNENIQLYNVYGPTETTMWVADKKVDNLNDVTIGKPLANTNIYILDKDRNLLPIGVAGELCISGDQVGKGYWNRPQLTAEKFIVNPFVTGKTIYCTGDLARWRSDGEIEFLGRIDTQVKIRGLRIELGEIETVMGGFPGIDMAVVADKRNENNRQYLVGYYTASCSIEEKDLRQYLAAKLPKYMVPNYFVRLEQIPTTPSGKTDRKILPLPDFSAKIKEYVALETKTECKLGEIWSELLHTNRIGKTDDFFELGGDSLMAISALSKIISAFQVELSVKDIMENPILEQLANFIDKANHIERKICAVHKDKYILLPQQKAIYASVQKDPQSLAYNMPTRVRLSAGIDRERLKSCIKRVVERHRSLKTRIVVENSELYGVYDADAHIEFEEYSTDDYNGFMRPFVLEDAPLVRIGFTEDSLLFDTHHIIVDGESLNTILHDITMLYNGVDTTLESIEFSDYSDYFYRADFSEHKGYFKNMLRCDFGPVELPKRWDGAGTGGASLLFHLPADVISQGRQFAKANGLTDTMLFLGVYGIMLSKYTGRADILSSVVLSNRTHSETAEVVGMFVNTLPVYLPVDGSVNEYFGKIRDLVLNLFQYQELPLLEIANAVGMADKTVVNTAFVYQADGEKRLELGGEAFVPEWLDTRSAKFDLLFEVTPTANGCMVKVEYDCKKYDEKLIKSLFNAYKKVFTQLTAENISDISVLSEAEYRKVVFDFNNTTIDYPQDLCVYELVEQQAKRTPDKTALIFEGKTYTYRQLDELSNGLAVSMRGLGIQQGDMVAVLLNRDEMVVLTQLAVLKIGAVFIPIDSRYPEDRIKYILSKSGAKIIFKNKNNELAIPQARNIEELDMLPTVSVEHPSVDAGDTCYIIFTSGSTGNPKGCTLTNRGLVNFCRNNNILETCNKLDRQVCISVNTISFDYFIAESLLPLTNGYTVVLASEEESVDQEQFVNLAVSTRANIIQTTPTRFKLYFDDKRDLSYMQQFDVIVTSGEALPLELLNTLHKNSSAKIFNPLGPSECSVWIAGGELHLSDGEATANDIIIGKPIANTQLYILDRNHNPLPVGVAGELCVSGDGVGNGYLNRPELTAERFIPNPFIKGTRMYCTGDLARWNGDGEIEYLGRIDTQVKIRGLRIELGEIENVMSQSPGISLAAATDKRDKTGRQYLVGYYTADDFVDESALRQYLSAKLPKYMVPNYFLRLEKLPMTLSGKLDRKNLPAPDFAACIEEYIPPRNDEERILCKIIGEILHYERVGIHDDFFELGGDSLRAIEFVAKAHGVGLYFALQNVFDYPTVEVLCDYLHNRPEKDDIPSPELFAKYNPILEKNVWDAGFTPERRELGTVLLTGGTGFLGAHILDALMRHGVYKIYCLVRGDEERLTHRLQYYFGDQYTADIGKTIIPVVGNLEAEDIGHCLPKQVDYVIHAAASVKHYGSWQYFKSANVDATQHIISYAKKIQARLIHVSTTSVSGNSMSDQFDGYVSEEEKHFYESSLYIGQPMDNVYIRSKFEAETLVLDAMRDGLRANIVRMGNLTNRKYDLKFQPNYEENAFLKRVKAILELGCIPDYLMSIYAEFSPVDSAAEAIMTIAEHMNDRYTVFHINSNKELYLDRMLEYLEQAGWPLRIIGGEQFAKLIRDTINSKQSYIFEALSNDLDKNDQIQYDSNIRIENSFTVQYLRKLRFEWPDIDCAYIESYLRYFVQLGYFQRDNP